MANLIIVFVLGATAGLLLRPVLDAYLFWRTADWFRRDPPTSQHPSDAELDHRTGV